MSQSNQSSAKNLNLRAQVIKTLLAVQNGQSLSSVLNQHINIVSERDRGLYHELTLGCLRQWFSLKAITLPLLTKPLDNEARKLFISRFISNFMYAYSCTCCDFRNGKCG
jgi:16S rRNA (cytosine967-C5)-methyltransferase